jgi:hypothetical protein
MLRMGRQVEFIFRLPAKAQAFRMKLLRKLTNPFVLVAEGFVVGAMLFASSTPHLIDSPHAPAPALDSSVIPNSGR